MQVREPCRPAEDLALKVDGREGELQPLGLQLCDVTVLLRYTADGLRVDGANEVVAAAAIGIDFGRDAPLEEAEAEASSIGESLLVGQVVVRQVVVSQPNLLRIGVPRYVGVNLFEGVRHRRIVGYKTYVRLQTHRRERTQMAEETLAVDTPR